MLLGVLHSATLIHRDRTDQGPRSPGRSPGRSISIHISSSHRLLEFLDQTPDKQTLSLEPTRLHCKRQERPIRYRPQPIQATLHSSHSEYLSNMKSFATTSLLALLLAMGAWAHPLPNVPENPGARFQCEPESHGATPPINGCGLWKSNRMWLSPAQSALTLVYFRVHTTALQAISICGMVD